MVEAIRQGDIPGVQLRYRRRLPLPVDEAWRWLADRAEVRPEGETALVLERAREEAAPLRESGETLEIAAPRRWSLAFRQLDSGWKSSTRLTLELHDDPEGCELDILQEGFEHLSLSTCLTVWEEYRRRWRQATARLVDQLQPASTITGDTPTSRGSRDGQTSSNNSS